ncbi:RHS repeat domain-containing protein, partial [Flavobacterium sp. Leaf359]|uniref:RHS repeat domain-containing protein n=1 Tax=Flavobacterium sp. Leaf359 TaxID=1736351 RepID=UPI0026F457E8
EGWHDTYYVYDDFGNLAFVLPPISDGSTSQADLDGLCYQYRYDERKRLVEKKLPGKQWEFIIYDNLDRVVATGPAFSPFNDITASGWLFTKYDVFGRIAYTGWMQASVTSAERNTLQAARNAQTANLSEAKTASDNTVNGVAFRYTNQAWPTGSGWHVFTVNYYDSYAFPGAPSAFADVEGQPVYYNLTVLPKGLPTGSWSRVLEASTAVAGELSYNLYDHKARPVRVRTLNYMGGYTQTDTKLDFSGKVLYTVTGHNRTATGSLVTVREDFTYSSQDRLLNRSHKIGNRASEFLSKNTYDELGQLISKKTGGSSLTAPLQKVDYAYNVRGWLKGINDTETLAKPGDPADLFAFKISYDDPLAAQPQFNGNISETYWRTANDNILRRYAYQFDSIGRLASASYQKPETISAPDSYRESQQYDKNGNIRKLQRFGEFDDAVVAMMVDDLDYAYLPNSNRVAKVTDYTNSPAGFRDDSDGTNDTQDDYAYDMNGNMVSDQNKNIDLIAYNHLNLPTKITFAGGATIEYLYNANGKKLRKTVTESAMPVKTQEYLDGFDYANGTLEAIHTAEGYVKAASDGTRPAFNYIYNYKDHLGNIRLSYTRDPVSEQVVIIEENNYYPFGLTHKNYNTTKRMYDRMGGGVIEFCPDCPFMYSYNYKFNGKEFQEELGLNMTAMDFRQYDNALGRFNSLDVLSELAPGITPYRFAYNNPVFWADPSGLFETKQAAMDHIQTYGLSGATVSYNDNRGYWEIDNNGYTFGYENGNFKIAYNTEDGATVLHTIKGSSFKNFFSDSSAVQTQNDSRAWNDTANALGIGMGIQQELIGYSIAQNYKSARNPWAFAKLRETQQAWRTTNTLGKVGKGLLTTTKVMGVASGVVQIGIKGVEIYDKGVENATVRDWADLGVNTAGVVAAVFFASNPVGWVVGAVALGYSIGTTIYDASN